MTPEERNRQRAREWYAKNRDAIRTRRAPTNAAVCRAWREKNIAANRENAARWQRENPARAAARVNRRRADRIKATPRWADSRKMEIVYESAAQMGRELGMEMHVDHVVPLRGKTVCGLHCEANFKIIPRALNQSKGNRVWPGMWSI